MPRIEEILNAEQLAAVKALDNGEAVLTAISGNVGSDLIDNRQGNYIDKSSGMYIPKTKFDDANNAKNLAESTLTEYKTQVKTQIETLKTEKTTLKNEYELKISGAKKTTALKSVLGMSKEIGGAFFAPEVVEDLLQNDPDFMAKVELDEAGKIKDSAAVIKAIQEHSRVGKLITKGNFGGSGSGGAGNGSGVASEELTAAKQRYEDAKKGRDRKGMTKAQNDIMRLEASQNQK